MRHGSRGFTLFEMTVTIAVIMFLTIASFSSLEAVEKTRVGRTYEDAIVVYNAHFGTREINGFYGDIGRLSTPANAPSEMVVAKPETLSAQNMATYNRYQLTLRGVTAGWKGPYTGFSPDTLSYDPWGRPWQFDANGRVTSLGHDGAAGTADDISVPPAGHATMLNSGAPVGQIDVVVIGPDWPVVVSGLMASVEVTNVDGSGNLLLVNASAPTGSEPHFRATGLVPGRHAIVVRAAAGSPWPEARGVGVAWVDGNHQSIVRIRLSRECCQGL